MRIMTAVCIIQYSVHLPGQIAVLEVCRCIRGNNEAQSSRTLIYPHAETETARELRIMSMLKIKCQLK